MSWSIQKSDENTEDLNRLVKALQEAAGHNILLFCSAPDIGVSNHQNMYHPFDCTELPKMFRIGAADASGTIYPWVGNKADFILPGANVTFRKCDMVVAGADDCPRTGSSVATALAAGLAALVIHCVRLGAIYNHYMENETGVSNKTLQVVKDFHVMKEAFSRIDSPGKSNKKDPRLGVETFFTEPAKRLKDSDTAGRWSSIAKLARDLVSSTKET